MPGGFELYQRLDNVSIGHAGFSMEGGEAQELYVTNRAITADDIALALRQILGDVAVNPSAHRLDRVLPLAHPRYPWLFAEKAEETGVGLRDAAGNLAGEVPANLLLEGQPITDKYWKYIRSLIRVTFAPRPYALYSDAAIIPSVLSYYDFDGGGHSDVYDSKEWQRYVIPDAQPRPERVSATHGQNWFRTSNDSEPGGPYTVPGGVAGPHAMAGFPWMIVPNGEFHLTWLNVPGSLCDDRTHPMHTYVGLTNQFDFFGFTQGQLVYMGPKFRRFTPVAPGYVVLEGGTTFSAERSADVNFVFEYTTRAVTLPPIPTNPNWVYKGHNAQPWWKTRKFYVSTAPTPGSNAAPGVPLYLSAPMQFLFRCP